MPRLASLALLLCLSTGCSLFNRVRLEPVATSFQKPSNVAVYVVVTDSGKPVTDLEPASFKIYENEQLLAADDTQQLLLPKELAVYHHTLLLVDIGGDGSSAEPLSRAVASFVETARATQPVSVFAFDGGPNLHSVGEFGRSGSGASVDLRALAKMASGDTSRNLNGALLSALKELDARLAAQPKRVRVGTLVVFTRGADLAGRSSRVDVDRALDGSDAQVIALGPQGLEGGTLEAIGKNGVVRTQGEDGLGVAFEEAAGKARDLYQNQYLIAYCSPARAGTRRLKVEVRFRDLEQGEDKAASFTQDFDATGFGPGCRSETVPRFVPQVARKSDGYTAPKSSGASTGSGSGLDTGAAPRVDTAAPSDDDSVAPPPDKPGYSH